MKEKELGALAFLKRFPEFDNYTPNEVLKACLMIVAVDARLKIEEAKKDEDTTEQT